MKSKVYIRIILSIAVMVLVITIFLNIINISDTKISTDELKAIQNSVVRSAVTCYAVEGKYPVNIEYMLDNYSLNYDKERYVIFYNNFASNIMPEINVVPIGGSSK